ncbi:MAG: tRNA (adenosine(37)-N6)-dimethylallyltransferase MiaA [Anaerolineae bacterium]|nr:tRNA (adenosine(37)-N6)-dimethylallyltransferase MiaA [Anaerolineae bacterium]
MPQQVPLIVIVGPTAVGKTSLALRLAGPFSGEIVSADSRQIYRGMDIGTGKPTPADLSRVPHHLIDIIEPDDEFTLADYQALADAAIQDIACRERVPFLVGGTGQYVRAIIEGWQIPRVPPDPILRSRLYAEAEESGPQALYDRLLARDPAAAAFIDPRNVRRVIRALEVCVKTGRPFSEQRGKRPPPYEILQIGLTMEREALYERIDRRIDEMIARGLVVEVQGLVARGYGWELPAMSSLGYLQFREHLAGAMPLEDAVALVKKETRRFVRQQYNWFRQADPRIHWLDASEPPYPAACTLIRDSVMRGTGPCAA